MSNRPHSREKRVKDVSNAVEKKEINNGPSRLSKGPSLKKNVSLSGVNRNNGFLGKIIRLVLIVLVIYFVFNFVTSLFSKEEVIDKPQQQDDSHTSEVVHLNNYLANHTVNHSTDTSSESLNLETSNKAREKFTKILGNGEDDITIMIYMIGSDLESQYGAASKDLTEMLHAGTQGNVNVVLQTGGCRNWNNNVMSSKYLERYVISADQLYQLQENIPSVSMTDPAVLSDFIKYSADNFPANRYFLILWDHGGGSVAGYGYDEKYPNSGSMSPDEISSALKASGIKFDLVGFDACLMANLETAIAIEPYADYMVGSEETEPGDGWFYTDWLNMIDSNTSMPTVELAKKIIDDYVDTSRKTYRTAEVTQSVVDLGELVSNIKEPLAVFAKAVGEKLNSDLYQEVANARANTKEFSRSAKLDQVDLVDLADNFDVKGSDELVSAIKSAVKYNRTANIADSYGLSSYFPYSSLSKMNQMVKIYDNINMDESYTSVVKSFASFASSGQIVTNNNGSSSTSIFDILMSDSYSSGSAYGSNDIFDLLTSAYDNSSYNNYGSYDSYGSIFGSGYDDWFDLSMINMISGFLGRDKIVDSSLLTIKNSNGQRVVSLTDSQWDLISSVLLNVYVDDGQGYIDMGLDNIFDWNDAGELIVDHDGTWLTIDDHFVAYYMLSDEYIDDDNYKTMGRIPAYLNDQKVDIIVSFTPDYPYGMVEGARLVYADTDAQQKGLIEIKKGDELRFLCNYYTYDGQFVNEYQLGDTYVVNGNLELNNEYLANRFVYTYCFNDVYGNKLYTEKTVVNK